MPQSIVSDGGYWGLLGDSKRHTIRYTRGILDGEGVVPTRVRAAATPLMYRSGEGVMILLFHVSLGRPISPLTSLY